MDCGTCGGIVHGAVGLAKAGLQAAGVPVDQAPPGVAARRLDVCRGCDQATRNEARVDRPSKGLTTFSRCKVCDCFLKPKAAIASEACPLGKW